MWLDIRNKGHSLYIVRLVLATEKSNTKSTVVLKKKIEDVPKESSCGNLWCYDLSYLVTKEHEDIQEHTCTYELDYSTDPKGD